MRKELERFISRKTFSALREPSAASAAGEAFSIASASLRKRARTPSASPFASSPAAYLSAVGASIYGETQRVPSYSCAMTPTPRALRQAWLESSAAICSAACGRVGNFATLPSAPMTVPTEYFAFLSVESTA